MSVKVISWGHTMKKTKGRGGSWSIPLFSFVPSIHHHLQHELQTPDASDECYINCVWAATISTVGHMHLFSFTWITLFSIHLLEMTRQLPPGPDRCLAKLPKICFYGFLFVLTFSVASMMTRWTHCDFSRWATTADKATPITIILLASFDCFPHGGCG